MIGVIEIPNMSTRPIRPGVPPLEGGSYQTDGKCPPNAVPDAMPGSLESYNTPGAKIRSEISPHDPVPPR